MPIVFPVGVFGLSNGAPDVELSGVFQRLPHQTRRREIMQVDFAVRTGRVGREGVMPNSGHSTQLVDLEPSRNLERMKEVHILPTLHMRLDYDLGGPPHPPIIQLVQ
jgi:hypothetical protein